MLRLKSVPQLFNSPYGQTSVHKQLYTLMNMMCGRGLRIKTKALFFNSDVIVSFYI